MVYPSSRQDNELVLKIIDCIVNLTQIFLTMLKSLLKLKLLLYTPMSRLIDNFTHYVPSLSINIKLIYFKKAWKFLSHSITVLWFDFDSFIYIIRPGYETRVTQHALKQITALNTYAHKCGTSQITHWLPLDSTASKCPPHVISIISRDLGDY